MKLPTDDPQIENLCGQLAVICTALIRRAWELDVPVDDQGRDILIASILESVRRGATKTAMPTGPVVDLSEARAAKAPRVVNSFSIEISDLGSVDALAVRLHGEATHATRVLVIAAAYEAGLRGLSGAGEQV